MNNKLTHEEFLEKLWDKNEHYRNGEFEVIGHYLKGRVRTKNKYGECLSRIYDLLNGSNISIETAIDKDDYFLNVFKSKNTNLFSQVKKLSKYVGADTKILWEHKFGIVAISPSEIIDKQKIVINSAVNKKEFYLSQVKEQRKDFNNIDYTNFVFKNFSEKGEFRCKIHNIEYRQSLSSHKTGTQGCVKCANKIVFYNDETIEYFELSYGKFYIMRLYNENESFYKVGITGVKGNKRKRDLKRVYDVEVVYEEESSLKEAYYKEKLFLEMSKDFKYTPLISFKGKNECFDTNPLILYDNLNNYCQEYRINRDKSLCEEYGINYEEQFNKY